MLSLLPLSAVAFSVVAAGFLGKYRKRQGSAVDWIFLYLTVVLPFAAGGFHTYVSAITAVCLVVHLASVFQKQGYLRLTLNFNSIAVMLVMLGYCITPMWAADKGMAVFGILRYVPVALYVLTLMQMTPEQKQQCLGLIPISGAGMTVLSCLLLLLPGTAPYLTVSSRLAGFLQYPNTYAAFLLAGLILQYSKESRRKSDFLMDAILLLGIILSGSKTVFVLLIVSGIWLAVIHRKGKTILTLGGLFAAAALFALLLSNVDVLQHGNRFRDIRITSGSFLLRLLYYEDVLPMILKNPIGYGYQGYRALLGIFQTGRYHAAYIHNGLLQLLFEIGWLPACAMAAAFLRAMFSRKTMPGQRLLLTILLAHCMLDFDLQFFIFWVILLTCLDFESSAQWKLEKKTVGIVFISVCLVSCLWMGAVDFCYSIGKTDISLRLMPSHTDSLSVKLRQTSDIHVLNETADRILKGNPTFSLAYSAKANAALSQGDILNMMAYKEQAIRCSPHTAEEYMDYFDKLYAVSKLYLQNGDIKSAEYCERKIVQIYGMVRSVQEATDPRASQIGDYMVLKLPIRYRIYMRMLNDRYQQA